MIVSKAPLRISLFGGSTDYKSFYEKYGSVIIGSTIDKYVYNAVHYRPPIVGKDYVITYSLYEKTDDIDKIKNPLIRETLRYYGVSQPVGVNFASDIPSRTGLGGSSSCCVSLAASICCLLEKPIKKEQICLDAIKIERDILKEPGGIQDQIWACYSGFNVISIEKDGSFKIKQMPVSDSFKKEFEDSLILIYLNKRRKSSSPSQAHIEAHKKNILEVANQALKEFKNENIKVLGDLLFQSWNEKKQLCRLISNGTTDCVIDDVMRNGAYGAKLLGGGNAGFVLVVCDKKVKKKLMEKYFDVIVDFRFETDGLVNTKI